MTASALVIGSGSIGARHRRILTELGLTVGVVSRRGGAGHFSTLADALNALSPGYVVVATETVEHGPAVDALAQQGFCGKVLVEKPLFATPRPLPNHHFDTLTVGYNLRFHPVLQRLAKELEAERMLSAQMIVGQYLPDWRPGRDYRTVYSAHTAEGGGVLRDLSHELDTACWLFGPWQRVAALGGHWSELEIDSDDVFALLGAFARCPAVTLQLNYLDRQTRRELVITTARHTFHADLIAGTLRRDHEPPDGYCFDRDTSYRAMHRAVLENHPGVCCAEDGQQVMALIAAAEHAARKGVWVPSSLCGSVG